MSADRRVKYTKMVLRDSLIKFLRDKPISRISIKSICEDADINRATYYAHYTDQFDQLKQIEAEFITEVNSYLDNFALEVGESDLMQMIEKIFECIKQNDELCRVLLGKNGDIDFQTNIMEIVSERVLKEWETKKVMDESTAEYIYTFVVTGSIGVIRKWLFEENSRTPKEMSQFLIRLVNNGLEKFVTQEYSFNTIKPSKTGGQKC